MRNVADNAVLNILQWATRELVFLNGLPSMDTWEKDLWIDLAFLIQQCGKLLNNDGDEYQIVEDAKDIKNRMDCVRGCDEWTLMLNQVRGFDGEWRD